MYNIYTKKLRMKQKINTPIGEGLLETVYVSELGYVMVKVYYPTDKRWVTYNINRIENILENTQLSIKND